ncbi:uncharacterized protein [Coffea arabica]|uniref:Craniofacial development protein 2-like n=1 Tax=Coffea arabica TaxID=13443 RepID=A0ABM4UEW4_COFAR
MTSNQEKKNGGRVRPEGSFREFNRFIKENELVDIDFEGKPWTWCNQWERDGEVKEKLDRCLGSVGWYQLFAKAICHHQETEASDHNILILDNNPNQRKPKKRFYFDQRWARNEDSKGIIETTWGIEQKGSRMFIVMRKIKECRMALLAWNRKLRMNSGKKITQIKEKLLEIKESSGEGIRGQIAELKLKLSKAYKEEELYWSQKARCRWLKEGDKNTAYFHASVMATRKRNKITILQRDNGNWCSIDQEVKEEICSYYQQMLTTKNTEEVEVPQDVPNTISRQMNERLIQPVEEAEIKKSSLFYASK